MQDDLDSCQPTNIDLPDEATEQLYLPVEDRSVIASPSSEQWTSAPSHPHPLEDVKDFYYEGELIVFTAGYHLRRGYCCQSRCRHCPY